MLCYGNCVGSAYKGVLSNNINGIGVINMTKTFKPGEDNKPPGKYIEVGPKGGKVKDPHTATIGKGDRLPPTSEAGNKWKKV